MFDPPTASVFVGQQAPNVRKKKDLLRLSCLASMVTIWLCNIAKPSIKGSFSTAMLNNQRVLHDRDMIGYFGRKVWNHSGGQ